MLNNILYVETGMGFGGSSISLLETVKHLRKYEPVIIFYASSDDEFTKLFSEYKTIFLDAKFTYKQREAFNRYVNTSIKSYRLRTLINIIFTVCSWFNDRYLEIKIGIIIKKYKISLMHLNNCIEPVPIKAAMRKNIPVVSHLRGHIDCARSKTWATNTMSALIAPTNKIASYAHEELGVTKNKIFLIYNSISIENYSNTDNERGIRKLYNISKNTCLVGIYARIRPMKGQLLLARVIVELLDEGADVACLFVGDESDFDKGYITELHNFIDNSKYNTRFIFAGYQRNVIPYYLAADIVMHSSIAEEAFGRVIIEAWASQKPVIATNIGASIELITHGKTGLIVPVDDMSKWKDTILLLMRDHVLYKKICRNGWNAVCDTFDSKKNIIKLENIYDKFIDI